MALRDGQWEVHGRVVKTVLAVTGTGKQQLAVTFEYEDQHQEKRYVTWYGFFTEAALPWTVEALRALGWDLEANDWNILTLDDTDLLNGREAILVLEEEEYEGQMRLKVRFVNPPGGAGVERLLPEEAHAFASDLRRRLMKVAPPKSGGARKAATGVPERPAAAPVGDRPLRRGPAPAPTPAAQPPVDLSLDDIPF